MSVRDRVRVSGPPAMFADGLREHLAEQGYSLRTTRELLLLLAHLSRWMEVHGLQASSLTPVVAEQLILERRRKGYNIAADLSAKSPRRVLGYLESPGALPVDEPVLSPLDEVLGAYARYLREERGIGERTVAAYAGIARQFLSGRPGSIEDQMAGLSGGEINAFVLREFRRHSQRSAERVVYALRALLRYLRVQGLIDQPLAGGVLSVARRRENLPRGAAGRAGGAPVGELRSFHADRLPRLRDVVAAGAARVAMQRDRCAHARRRRLVGGRCDPGQGIADRSAAHPLMSARRWRIICVVVASAGLAACCFSTAALRSWAFRGTP